MKLKTVAFISLVVLVFKEIISLVANQEYIMGHFWRYILSSVETWVLVFFFVMLFFNSRDE